MDLPTDDADDRPTSVFAAIEAVCERTPDGVALLDDEGAWTFEELRRAALGLAAELASLPAGPVALVVPSRASTMIGYFGLAAAGRVSVPLDPTFPLAVLRDLHQAAGAVALIAPPDLHDLAVEIAGELPVLAWVPDRNPATLAEPAVLGPAAPLTVYFTSGSTGAPKGVVHTQRNWVDAGLAMAGIGLSEPGRRYLLMSPMSFAAAGIIASFALFGGSTLAIYDARSRGLADLPEWIRRNEITCLVSIPSAVRAVIAATGGAPLGVIDQVIYGGEMVTRDDLRSARSLSGSVDVVLLYVSTELGLVTFRHLRPEEPLPAEEPVHSGWTDRRTSIGEIRLVSDDGELCAPGDVGRIEVRSRRLSHFLTEDGVPDAPDDDSLVDTGDLGRFHEDGGLQIVGRADQMVKIRGYRIDQADVERRLRELGDVADVCVVVSQTGRGTPQLVAHVVPASGDVTAAGVRSQLFDRMPPYLVPARIFLTEALPRLRNGKVDRVSLRIASTQRDDRSTGRAAETPTEKAIARAFGAILGRDDVAADDDFFDLGGTSLEVAELLVRLGDALAVPVPASLLTHHSTPEQLAAALDQRSDERSTVVLLQHAAGGDRPPIHLVYDLHGSPFRMRRLAHALGDDQTVYGFECPLIYGRPDAPSSIREIAAQHVSDLLRVQPEGPYHLAGYSVGSTFMWEIAAQLTAAGHEVGLAGAIDFGPVHFGGPIPRAHGPKPPGTYPVRAPSSVRGVDRVRFHLDRLHDLDGAGRLRYLSQQARVGREYALVAGDLDIRRHGEVRPSLRGAWAWYRLLNAAHDWTIPTAPIDLTLFLCDQTAIGNIVVSRRVDHESRRRPTLGWEAYARAVDVRPVIGYHNALVEEPYVGGVGAAVRAALDEVVDR